MASSGIVVVGRLRLRDQSQSQQNGRLEKMTEGTGPPPEINTGKVTYCNFALA